MTRPHRVPLVRACAEFLARRTLRKVPAVGLLFWVIKLLTTAVGESTSDYLVHAINPVVAVLAGAFVFLIALLIQLRVDRYRAWVYWLAVVMVAVFGTMAADATHIVLHVPYLVSTIVFAVALAAVLVLWYLVERTLSFHGIDTLRRELFYWAAVVAAFALGTAAGDLTAYTLGLGFFTSGVLFVALFALPGLAFFALGLNEIVAFWGAYVLTRPLGASFADWAGKPPGAGGLGWGDGAVSALLAILILACVGYLAVTHADVSRDLAGAAGVPAEAN